MHILIIPSWYPTSENPINGIFFLEQAQALQKAGHQVSVLVPPILKPLKGLQKVRSVADLKPSLQVEMYQGLKTYRTFTWNWSPRPRHWFKKHLIQRYGVDAFKAYLENEGKPDLIHAHSILYGGYLAVQIAQKWHIPTVLAEHFTGFVSNTISGSQVHVVRETLKKIDAILAVGPALKMALQTYIPEKDVKILGNMIDTNFFSLVNESLPKKPFVFCLIAFLTPKKGSEVLIQAFAKMFKGKDVILRIAGDGTDKVKLMDLTGKLNISRQVEFLGLLPRIEIRKLLHQSHALVSSSYVETFGVNLIEAMACGKPVIATRSGGPEMFVNDSNGILVPVGDVNALAEAMQTMVDNYHQYDPKKIRAECVARFSEAAIIKQLETIYQDVIDANAD